MDIPQTHWRWGGYRTGRSAPSHSIKFPTGVNKTLRSYLIGCQQDLSGNLQVVGDLQDTGLQLQGALTDITVTLRIHHTTILTSNWRKKSLRQRKRYLLSQCSLKNSVNQSRLIPRLRWKNQTKLLIQATKAGPGTPRMTIMRDR